MAQDHTAPVFHEDGRRTRSLERAADVIEYIKRFPNEPVLIQEVADRTDSYYDETLHIVTTLEALGMVQRYRRDGSPREGGRVAYSWIQPTTQDNRAGRRAFIAAA